MPEGSCKVEDASSTPSAAIAMMTSWAISPEPSPAYGNIEGSPSTPSMAAIAAVVGSCCWPSTVGVMEWH